MAPAAKSAAPRMPPSVPALPPLPSPGAPGRNGYYLYGMHKLVSARSGGASSRRRERPAAPTPYDSPRRQLLLTGDDPGAMPAGRLSAREAQGVDPVHDAAREFGDCLATQRIHRPSAGGSERFSAAYLPFFPEECEVKPPGGKMPPRRYERATVPQVLPAKARFAPDRSELDEHPRNLHRVYRTMCTYAGDDGRLDRHAWERAMVADLGVSDAALAGRVFGIFDRSDSGQVSVRAVMKGLTALLNGPHKDKAIESCFDLFAMRYPDEDTEEGIITKKALLSMRNRRAEQRGRERGMVVTLLGAFHRGETDRPEFMTHAEFRHLLLDGDEAAEALPPFLGPLMMVLERQYHEMKQREERGRQRTGARGDAK